MIKVSPSVFFAGSAYELTQVPFRVHGPEGKDSAPAALDAPLSRRPLVPQLGQR